MASSTSAEPTPQQTAQSVSSDMKPKSTNEPKLVLNPFKSGDNFREWAVSFVRILQATGRPYYPVLLARKVGGIDVPTDPTTLLQLQMNLFHFLCECLVELLFQ